MTVKQSDLVIGRFYVFWIKRQPISPCRAANGAPARPGYPGTKPTFVGQLIDKRSNGTLILQQDVIRWDRPMMDPEKKAVRKTLLREVKAYQIVRVANEQPAERVPHPPTEAAA